MQEVSWWVLYQPVAQVVWFISHTYEPTKDGNDVGHVRTPKWIRLPRLDCAALEAALASGTQGTPTDNVGHVAGLGPTVPPMCLFIYQKITARSWASFTRPISPSGWPILSTGRISRDASFGERSWPPFILAFHANAYTRMLLTQLRQGAGSGTWFAQDGNGWSPLLEEDAIVVEAAYQQIDWNRPRPLGNSEQHRLELPTTSQTVLFFSRHNIRRLDRSLGARIIGSITAVREVRESFHASSCVVNSMRRLNSSVKYPRRRRRAPACVVAAFWARRVKRSGGTRNGCTLRSVTWPTSSLSSTASANASRRPDSSAT